LELSLMNRDTEIDSYKVGLKEREEKINYMAELLKESEVIVTNKDNEINILKEKINTLEKANKEKESDLHSKTDLISSLENDLEKTSQALKQNKKELEDTVTDLNS